MAKSERQDGGTRGGVGTMIQPGPRPGPVPAPDAAPLEQRRGRRARPEVPPQRSVAAQQAARAQQPGTRQRPVPRPAGDPRVAADQRPLPDQRAATGRRAAPVRQPGSGRRFAVPHGTARPNTQGAPAMAAPATATPRTQAAPRTASAATPVTQWMPFVLLLCGLLGGALVSAIVISTTLDAGSFEITNLQQSVNDFARTRQALEEEVAQAKSAPVIEARAAQLGMRPVGVLRYVDLSDGKTPTDQATGWESRISQVGYTP